MVAFILLVTTSKGKKIKSYRILKKHRAPLITDMDPVFYKVIFF